MTITQMEYIIAVEKFGSFVTAAESCNVTQPTLSMQIQKLEDELGIKLFDRNHHPVLATELGLPILMQAKNVLFEVNKIYEILNNKTEELKGNLNVGILPTLAPYVLPKMLNAFMERYPNVELQIFEMTTENLTKKLKEDKIDFGILSTPLHDKELKETPIYYEAFVCYFSNNHQLLSQKTVHPKDLDINELWTLNDEHCMHFQVINLCNEKAKNHRQLHLQYQSGSIQSLVKMVETNGGTTIIPELSIEDFYEHQLENIRFFDGVEPTREVSLVTNRYFTKNKIANAFVSELSKHIPSKMLVKNKKRNILEIK